MIVYRNSSPRKYRNIPVQIGEYKFDSKKEGRRYEELVLKVKAGLITDSIVHPKFELSINKFKIGTYSADFEYRENGALIVEDVKGWVRTESYRLKRKLMKALHNIEIREI